MAAYRRKSYIAMSNASGRRCFGIGGVRRDGTAVLRLPRPLRSHDEAAQSDPAKGATGSRMSSDPNTNVAGKRITVRRFFPLLILLVGLGLFFATGLN